VGSTDTQKKKLFNVILKYLIGNVYARHIDISLKSGGPKK